jgi:hypothetical protein
MAEATIDFLVDRSDLRTCRVARGPAPDALALAPGQTLLAIDRFALTANNVTYAAFGDALRYWQFFPAEAPFGRVPVWGFADVARSAHEAIAPGERVYGYFPMSSHLVVEPQRVSPAGFVDGAAHRAGLPPVYNQYSRVARGADPAQEDARMLFGPLFTTAFLLDDLLASAEFFGARAVVLGSASSKTALSLAFLLSRRAGARPEVVGLTSSANRAFCEASGCYDRVLGYDAVDSLPVVPSAFVDMAGDGRVQSGVHRRLGDALRYSCGVGATHWEAPRTAGDLPGPKPVFFFAPDQGRKRAAEWGAAGFDARVEASFAPFVAAAGRWIKVERHEGPEAVRAAYLSMLGGRTPPDRGVVLSLRPAS